VFVRETTLDYLEGRTLYVDDFQDVRGKEGNSEDDEPNGQTKGRITLPLLRERVKLSNGKHLSLLLKQNKTTPYLARTGTESIS